MIEYYESRCSELEKELKDKTREIDRLNTEIASGGTGSTCCHGYVALTPADVEGIIGVLKECNNDIYLESDKYKINERITRTLIHLEDLL